MIDQAWEVIRAYQEQEEMALEDSMTIRLSNALTALHMALELEPDDCVILRTGERELTYDITDPVSLSCLRADIAPILAVIEVRDNILDPTNKGDSNRG